MTAAPHNYSVSGCLCALIFFPPHSDMGQAGTLCGCFSTTRDPLRSLEPQERTA
jgi:hypothetical protein